MITIKIIGGLGNQMFSYAFGKSMALKSNSDLIIDLSWIKSFEKKKEVDLYGLKYFKMLDEEKVSFFNSFFNKTKILNLYKGIKKYLPKFITNRIILEEEFKFDEKKLCKTSNKVNVVHGYWQSYKYFEEYEIEIKKALTFKEEVYFECKKQADLIMQEPNSISMHIRRGDYANNPSTKKVHGEICTKEYYQNSMNYFRKKLSNPVFFIFSDEIQWAKDEFKNEKDVKFIEENVVNVEQGIGHQDKGYIDMYLMSLCKNNIIANSSFSWWAAWLNKNSSKEVLCPSKWFNKDIDTSDLIPPQWVKMSIR